MADRHPGRRLWHWIAERQRLTCVLPPRLFRFHLAWGDADILDLRIKVAGGIGWHGMPVLAGHCILVVLAVHFFPEPAGRKVPWVDFEQWRVLLFAFFAGIVAARDERAHVREIDEIGRKPADRLQLFLAPGIEPGNRLHEANGVWMTRVCENLFGAGGFDNVTGVHHLD